jgi:predicted phage tail protein
MSSVELPWWLAEFYNTEDLRDVETRLLVQRTAILAVVGAAALVAVAGHSPSVLEAIVGVGGFVAVAVAMPGVAQLIERATLFWSTRAYPLEGGEE